MKAVVTEQEFLMPTLPTLLHVGHVVPDLDVAARQLVELWGGTPIPLPEELGPSVTDGAVPAFDLPYTEATLKGEPARFTARYGFVEVGGIQIELIQPVVGPTPYDTFLQAVGAGIHHFAYIVEDIEAHLVPWYAEHPDTPLLLDARLQGGIRVVYVEYAIEGTVFELIQRDAF